MITIPQKFKKLPAGDYICKIIKVETTANRYYEPCLLLYLDIVSGEYENYFGTIYQNRKLRGNDRYPCIYSQNMSNYSIKFFKQLLNTIIASNPEYTCTCQDGSDWDEQELQGLLVGVTFEERQFVNDRGRHQTNLIPVKFKDINSLNNEETNE